MAIMKKDVNFVFFILIIATVISFAGFTAYYQSSFKNISNEYNQKIGELTKVSQDLLEKKSALLQTSEALDETKSSREQTEALYGEQRDELREAIKQRDTFKDDLFQEKQKFAKADAELTIANAKVIEQADEIKDLKDDEDFLERKLAECNDKLED